MDIDQKAKQLRIELKNLGYSNRKISVIVQNYSSINVNIKDVSISINEIKPIADKYKSIDYCKKSGEILAGGNDFVFVRYDYNILNNEGQKYHNYCKKLMEENKNSICFFENEKIKLYYFGVNSVDVPFVEIYKNGNFTHNRYYCHNYVSFSENIIKIQADYNIKINV